MGADYTSSAPSSEFSGRTPNSGALRTPNPERTQNSELRTPNSEPRTPSPPKFPFSRHRPPRSASLGCMRENCMNRPLAMRMLAFAACLAFLGGGCGRKSRSSSPPPPDPVAFFDNFSGPFPDPNWDIMEGDPFTSGDEGNAAPSLILNPAGGVPIRILSSVAFETHVPVTV